MLNIGFKEENYKLSESKRVFCQEHSRERAIGICQAQGCLSKFFCQKCQSQHLNHNWVELDLFIIELSERIKKTSSKNYKEFKTLKENKEYNYIFKYLQDSEQHLRRVEDHYKAQKLLLQEDVDNLANGFYEICQNIKDVIFIQLDSQFNTYSQQFYQLKESLDSHFDLGNKWRNALSSSNLLAKLQQIQNNKLSNQVDKILVNLRRVEGQNWDKRVNEIQNMIMQINDKNINLPVYRNDFQCNQILDQLKQQIETAFNDNLNFQNNSNNNINNNNNNTSFNLNNTTQQLNQTKQLQKQKTEKLMIFDEKPSSVAKKNAVNIVDITQNVLNPINNHSQNNMHQFPYQNKSVSNNNNNQGTGMNQENIRLKDKISTEDEISCGIYINNYLVFSSQKNDNKLNIMDSMTQQIIQSQEGHSQQIILMSSLIYNQHIKRTLLTTSTDKTLIMWQIVKKNNIYFEQLQKLLGFFAPVSAVKQLKEQGVLVTGDQKGELILWDFLKSKILYAFRGQHNSQIISLDNLEANKFIVASIDNTISIWKTKAKTNTDLIDLCVCEKIISDNFQGITNLAYIKNDLVIVTTLEGCFKLYDINNKQTIDSQQVHEQRIVELVYQDNFILTLSADDSLALISIKNNQIQVVQKLSQLGLANSYLNPNEPKSRLIYHDNTLTLLADQPKEIQFYQIKY